MRKLRFMLWLAMVVPFSWWAWCWWKIYFQKRVYYIGSTRSGINHGATESTEQEKS